jgi:Na+-translocating ferredoxin:NAD+ oxidoreductase RnfE subunit
MPCKYILEVLKMKKVGIVILILVLLFGVGFLLHYLVDELHLPPVFVFLIISQIVIIIITIVKAVSKGYSGFLAFLLGLFIPLLGSLVIILLLPEKEGHKNKIENNSNISFNPNDIKKVRF